MKTYILSGGKSTRMGTDKGLQMLQGKPLILPLLESLKKINAEVVIIAHYEEYQQFGLPIIKDRVKEKGPLGGIFTALCDAKNDVMILSADTPFITPKHISELKNKHRKGMITVPFSEGKYFPLFAIYPYSLINSIKKNIESGKLKLLQFLDENEINAVELALSPLEKTNINTKEDLENVENRLENGN